MLKDNLRRRRLEMGLSQDELAARAGYHSRSSISKLESGSADVSGARLAALASALDTTAEALLSGPDEEEDGRGSSLYNESAGSGRSTFALIQAGGKSTRNRMNTPNQFLMVDHKPVIVYVLEAYERHPLIGEIDIVCTYGWENILRSYIRQYRLRKVREIITGGDTILSSIRLGLHAMEKRLKPDDRIILQEATRPMISHGMISQLIASFDQYGSSIFAHSMNDYVSFLRDGRALEYIDRNRLFSMESPEIYRAGLLLQALRDQKARFPDEGFCCAVMMHRLGIPLRFCESDVSNLKIIRQEDAYYFKALKQLEL